MKKALNFLLLLLLICVYQPLPIVQAASSLGNPDPMSVACASGYIRTLPHYCTLNGSWSGVVLTLDGTCRSINIVTIWGIPSSAKYLDASLEIRINSNNGIALRRSFSTFYGGSACTAPIIGAYENSIQEFAATAIGTELLHNVSNVFLPTFNGTIQYIGSDLGTSSTPLYNFYVNGYYD